MELRRTLRIFLALAGSSVLLTFPSSLVLAQTNPYGLTTDQKIKSKYPQEVFDYWEEHGQRSDFQGQDDIKIAYMTFVREPREVAIVISSGRTESFIKYKELVFDLGKQGYSIFIHDHRGQGLSGRMMPSEPQKGYVESFDDYVADLKEFFDDIVLPTNHKKHVLLAHSMGGAIASLYIEKYRDDFDAAVLSSPMHEPGTGLLPQVVACKILDLKDWIGNEDKYAPGKGPYDEDESFKPKNCCTHSPLRYQIARDEYAVHPEAKLGGPSVKWALEACGAAKRARNDAGKITIPVLLLQGGGDEVVTPEGQKEFCKNLNAVRRDGCRLVVVENAYHELFIERNDFRIPALTEVLGFIKEVSVE